MNLFVTSMLAGSIAILAWPQEPTSTAGAASAQSTQAKVMRIKMGPPIVANMLLTHPQPVYPQEAKDKKVQGTVKLHVVIGTDGTVKQADAISGDPLLTQPALDAVRQWTYRPTLLNGEAVEVDSEVVVVYQLKGKKTGKAK